MRGRVIGACAFVLLLMAVSGAGAARLPAATSAGDRAAWRAILHWPSQCEGGWRATGSPGAGIELMPAGASGELVAVECFPGAYQGDAILYLVKTATRSSGPLRLEVYVDPGNGHPRLRPATVILGVLNFTAASRTLTVFDEYRGLGDCGIFSRYRLERGRFVLVEARAKSACNGKPPFSPERWPKLPV